MHSRSSHRRTLPSALLALVALARPTSAAPVVTPAHDGEGTIRLDGGAPIPTGGAVLNITAGMATTELGGWDVDRLFGFGAMLKVAPAVELGLGMTDLRRRPDALPGPLIRPGPMVAQLRSAGIPRMKGLSLTLAAAAPIAEMKAYDQPMAAEFKVGFGRDLGPIRPIANVAAYQIAGEEPNVWAGGGCRVRLPWGTHFAGDVQHPLDGDLRIGAELGLPMGPGTTLVTDGWRRTEVDGSNPDYELTLNLVLQTAESGPGRAYRIDRDGDGVVNAEDACPKVWGDTEDGCPSPVYGLEQCACPFDDFSLFELERLVMSLSVRPTGQLYVLEVRVNPVGDAMEDWHRTQEALEGTRTTLIKAGVPKENFVVVGRKPLAIEGIPLLGIRQMPYFKVQEYVDTMEFRKPSLVNQPR